MIFNELLKAGSKILLTPLEKLFNLLFTSHKYPYIWCRNLLVSIFKGGDSYNPDDYRGIAISSCLSKLYGSILNKRLESAIKKFSLLSDKQIGFIGGFRTSDHIFVDQIVKVKRKQLLVAFVDLRKAYDRVHRKAVFYKLKKLGINGIFLDSLHAMYNKVEMIGKIKNRILPPVTTFLGLKQGDNLSPLLFDLFFDDVDTILTVNVILYIFFQILALLTISYLLMIWPLCLYQELVYSFV